MVSQTVNTLWGSRHTVDVKPEGLSAYGWNQTILERANGSYWTAVWNGTRTVTNIGGNLSTISNWAASHATFNNYPIQSAANKQLYLINSTPTGATVKEAGNTLGTTPFDIQLDKTQHTFNFSKEHALPETKTAGYFAEQKPLVIMQALEPDFSMLPPTPPEPPNNKGDLQITSNPTGARIHINFADTNKNTPNIFTLDAGINTIKLVKEGYSDTTQFVNVVAQTSSSVNIFMPPIAPPPTPTEKTWDDFTETEKTAFLQKQAAAPSGETMAIDFTDFALLLGPGGIIKLFSGMFKALATRPALTLPILSKMGTAGFLNIVKEAATEIPKLATLTAKQIFTKVTSGKAGIKDFAATINSAHPNTLKAIAKIIAEADEEVAKVIVSRLTSEKTGRIAFVTLQPYIKAFGKPALSRIARTMLQITQVATLPLLAIFAITEIPQLFLMSTFARTEIPNSINFQLKKFEDSIETLFYDLGAAIRDGDTDRAAEIITQINKTIDEYNNYIENESFQGMSIKQILQDNSMFTPTQAMLATFRLKIQQALEQEIPEAITATTGQVILNTEPTNVIVRTASEEIQYSSGTTIIMSLGLQDIVIEAEGYIPSQIKVLVEKDLPKTLSVILKELPTEITQGAGRLQLIIYDDKTNAPISAALMINGAIEPYTTHTYVLDLEPDTYELRIEKVGYDFWTDTIPITEGETFPITARLIKTPTIEPPPPTEPPPDIEPEEPEKARIELNSNPKASVWILGEEVLTETPGTIELTPGIYSLTFKADGHENKSYTIYPNAGETIPVNIVLRAIEEPPEQTLLAKVSFRTEPSSAKISINGEFIEKYTPDFVYLEEGEYLIELTKSSYTPYVTPLKLEKE